MVLPLQLPNQRLAGQRVLVTGATGFVGGRLAERLVREHGVEVRGTVRDWTKAVWISRYPVDLVPCDVRDDRQVDQAVDGCSIVFHCASGGGADHEYLDININGTRNILDACCRRRVRRLVYVSSIAVHGPNPPDGANEFDAYRPSSRGYSDSKIEAERLVFGCHQRHALEVTVIRPTFVWGPRSQLFTVRPLREMAQGRFRLVNQGSGSCHAVFIEHLVDAILASAVRDEAVGRPFLVADGYGITWGEFFAPYAQWLGIETLPSLSSRSHLLRIRCRMYQQLLRKLEQWKGNPAPLRRRIVRRSARILADTLARYGVMSAWDLAKYGRTGNLDTSSTVGRLGIRSRYSFPEAMRTTKTWVDDQLGFELGLVTEFAPAVGQECDPSSVDSYR
jgi:nucleoside-diphosphate-sugar epimerase